MSRALFFFFMGVFALEAFLDINPTNVTVTGTPFSVSYYVYLTFYDLVRYFPAGFAFLGIGAVLFALSKYKLIPLALAGFVIAFYYEIVMSVALMAHYQSTYACHFVYSGPNTGYYCPLTDMVQGNPNIPLQGDVTGFIAFIIAIASFFASRLHSSLKVALIDMFLMASGAICIFEILLYFFESAFYLEQVTYFQDKIYLSKLTNQDLLAIAAIVFLTALAIRLWRTHRRVKQAKAFQAPQQL